MSDTTVDLKKTVNLPENCFSDEGQSAYCRAENARKVGGRRLYQRIREVRAGRPQYVLHDGPPYANGNIHLGTAFNKILKDFIVKSKSMAGFDAPYVPGWDCHGLPIEFKVDQELGKRKATMSVGGDPRASAARMRRNSSISIARSSSAWAYLGRWEDPYLTMSAEYESVIAQAFVDFLA